MIFMVAKQSVLIAKSAAIGLVLCISKFSETLQILQFRSYVGLITKSLVRLIHR